MSSQRRYKHSRDKKKPTLQMNAAHGGDSESEDAGQTEDAAEHIHIEDQPHIHIERTEFAKVEIHGAHGEYIESLSAYSHSKYYKPLDVDIIAHAEHTDFTEYKEFTENTPAEKPEAEAENVPSQEIEPYPAKIESTANTPRPRSVSGHETRTITQHTPTPVGELTNMLDDLRESFIAYRAVSSRPDAGHCGVCYMAFPAEELRYREADGLYICPQCNAALQNQRIPMIRRQRK